MDLKDIKAIIDLMKKNSISEFELERQEFKIKLKRGAFGQSSDDLPSPVYHLAPAGVLPAPSIGSNNPSNPGASGTSAPAPAAGISRTAGISNRARGRDPLRWWNEARRRDATGGGDRRGWQPRCIRRGIVTIRTRREPARIVARGSGARSSGPVIDAVGPASCLVALRPGGGHTVGPRSRTDTASFGDRAAGRRAQRTRHVTADA